jgi:APA family basic amino acid/polyamine antiporter
LIEKRSAPPPDARAPVALERGIGLPQALATNIVTMVGIGPFLTIPFMVVAMNGPHIVYAWVGGALLALADGLVYAHLGAALPGSGGPYLYLREAYKPLGMGGLMAFTYVFQIILVAPLSVAGGAVGFADYLRFYWTGMTPLQHDLAAAAVCVLMTALVYRDIRSVGRLTVAMLVVVLVTISWVIVAGLFTFSPAQAFDFPARAYRLDRDLLGNLGAAAILAMYSYGGYNQVCYIGEEIRDPARTMPRAILLSIVVVAALYIVMSTVILGLMPWAEVGASRTIASVFIGRTFGDPAQGHAAGLVMTGLILFVASASLFTVILGYSRIPFAAARDGHFFRAFARVHPRKRFPHVATLTVGAAALPFCFFSLGQIVSWLMQVQILMVFVWQCAGVILLVRRRPDLPQPFRMWLYPLPALLSLGLWTYVFFTGPRNGVLFAFGFLLAAWASYWFFRRRPD